MEIIVRNNQKKVKINKKQVERFVEKVLKYMALPDNTQVGILLTDNEQIHILNKKYRKVDRPTDVIAFAMHEGERGDLHPEILGDIIISVEKTLFQAPTYNHSFQEEFDLLLVHGILHLLGYDHMRKNDEVKMQALEQEILNFCI